MPVHIDLDPIAAQSQAWQNLAPGLYLLELVLEKVSSPEGWTSLKVLPATAGRRADLALLRSDPAQTEYSLHMASEDGLHCSLRERARQHGLVAAINAGMYLAENFKHTGYMRNATHINNDRVVKNFGAFFLAGPRLAGLPEADLQEKTQLGDKLNAKIADYNIVVQNYRLISREGNILWPESGETFSICALGKDRRGNILFIVCETPLTPPDFARLLLALPLEIELAMYLEGGSPAGMAVLDKKEARPAGAGQTKTGAAGTISATGAAGTISATGAAYKVWTGRPSGFNLGNLDKISLPNVFGLRPKK